MGEAPTQRLIPVTMGLWVVWTWSKEWEQERLTQRARLVMGSVRVTSSFALLALKSQFHGTVKFG